MAYLQEEANWEEGIYQYEVEDWVEGGPDGIDNIQAKALANRTRYLKAEVESISNGLQELFLDQTEQWNLISQILAQIGNLFNGVFSDVKANPFLATFGDAGGWEMLSGVWNRQHARVEC